MVPTTLEAWVMHSITPVRKYSSDSSCSSRSAIASAVFTIVYLASASSLPPCSDTVAVLNSGAHRPKGDSGRVSGMNDTAFVQSAAGLACDGVPMASIAERFGTPVYVFT